MPVRVSVIGASGYGGAEAVRLLATHPQVHLAHVTADTQANQPLASLYPNLRGFVDLITEALDPAAIGGDSDLVIVSLPSGKAMEIVPELLERGTRVIDVAADFRLKDPAQYPVWYRFAHTAPQYLAEAAYGLPGQDAPGHNHTAEIEQELSDQAGGRVRVTFVPHLIPMTRGLLVTAYAPLTRPLTSPDAMALYREAYAGEPFVRVLPDQVLPQTKATAGSNFCDVAVRIDPRAEVAVAIAAL